MKLLTFKEVTEQGLLFDSTGISDPNNYKWGLLANITAEIYFPIEQIVADGFLKKVLVIADEAKDYIISILKERGNDYQLINPQDIEEDRPDEFYELPRVMSFGKYNTYDEYSVVTLNLDESGKVQLEGVSIDGETDEVDKTFNLDDERSSFICYLADVVRQLEEGK